MTIIKLFKHFNKNDLLFKDIRKTNTGSRIIDIESNILYQTGWLKILFDVDYTICVDADKIKHILSEIDDIIIDKSVQFLDFSKADIINMYKPLLKKNGDSCCFCISILTNTVLFDKDKNYFNKSEIKNILKQGNLIRFIFSFKKIYFKDHEINVQLELNQIELV